MCAIGSSAWSTRTRDCQLEVFRMELEKRIAKIERISVRLFGLAMLFLALLGLFIYASFELIKFVWRLWLSW